MTLHCPDRSRRGITLLEVLTAIFIMGVGLLALLTLFPLGALNMAQAVRDDRAAAAGANAAALAVAHDLRNDTAVALYGGDKPPGFLPYVANATPPTYPLLPDPYGPGYPVFVDPFYVNLGSGSLGSVPGVTPGVLRVSPGYVTASPAPLTSMARWFTFQDEIGFQTTGQPVGDLPSGGGGSIRRPGTYSWAYLVRRPRSSRPDLTEVSVVVYAGRPTDSVSGEGVHAATSATANSVTFSFSGEKPNIRKGGWILDTSYVASGGYGTVNGHFYRVANVIDDNATTMTLELETSLKAGLSHFVIMENVIAVLDRGTGGTR